MTYAVVKIAGKQYFVEPKMKIKTEKIEASAAKKELEFSEVLLAGDEKKITVGRPFVTGVKVKAELLANKRAKKVIAFRYKSKTRLRKKRGHRQHYSELLIKEIKF